MSLVRIAILTILAMIAFAGNSILCRIALKHTKIDAASFTSIRLLSGAAVLWAITILFRRDRPGRGNWFSAFALFTYAAGFSFAYISLTAATGALLLFSAVQATMIGYGLWAGERLHKQQLVGLALAFGGLVGLLLPGLSAPPLSGSVLMLIAGIAWGVYSLRGKGAGDPTRVTAGNFLRASLFTALMSVMLYSRNNPDLFGVWYAITSGAITSGLGYAIWYSVVPALKASSAATVQLSVPVIAALGGIIILGEAVTARFVLASSAILGGIALVILSRPTAPMPNMPLQPPTGRDAAELGRSRPSSSAMGTSITWKHLSAWFLMLLVSIANGAVRDFIYGNRMSELSAHQLSTLIGILLLGAVIRAFVHAFPPSSDRHALVIGLFWLVLTVAFEFLFFHFAGGREWSVLLADYNILAGRVWLLVLIWITIAPYVFFHCRRLDHPTVPPTR